MSISRFAQSLPDDYGYVILVAGAGSFVNNWMAYKVGKARKKFEVKCPTMYSPDNNEFNCIQRAHQNTLEGHPEFLMHLFIGGLQYPRISAGCGAVYLVSRVAYALGYYTGEPRKRRWGAFGLIPLMVLAGCTLSFAAHQLKWCGTPV